MNPLGGPDYGPCKGVTLPQKVVVTNPLLAKRRTPAYSLSQRVVQRVFRWYSKSSCEGDERLAALKPQRHATHCPAASADFK